MFWFYIKSNSPYCLILTKKTFYMMAVRVYYLACYGHSAQWLRGFYRPVASYNRWLLEVFL